MDGVSQTNGEGRGEKRWEYRKGQERGDERRGHISLLSKVSCNVCMAADSEISALMYTVRRGKGQCSSNAGECSAVTEMHEQRGVNADPINDSRKVEHGIIW